MPEAMNKSKIKIGPKYSGDVEPEGNAIFKKKLINTLKRIYRKLLKTDKKLFEGEFTAYIKKNNFEIDNKKLGYILEFLETS